MAYIIYYNKDGSETNTTKIRSIDKNIYRKLMCNDVHKKFSRSQIFSYIRCHTSVRKCF